MPPLTQEYLDERLEATTKTILEAVQVGFANVEERFREHEARFEHIEKTLATLVESVDRFAKIYADLNQEFVVMRQHLRDVEARVEKLELKIKAA